MEEEAGGARRGGEEQEAAERGPGAAYHMFVMMEDLLEKLKLLNYEEEALRLHHLRPLSSLLRLPTCPAVGCSQLFTVHGSSNGGRTLFACGFTVAEHTQEVCEISDISTLASVLWKVTAAALRGSTKALATHLMHLMLPAKAMDSLYIESYFGSRATSPDLWDRIIMKTWETIGGFRKFYMWKQTFMKLCEKLSLTILCWDKHMSEAISLKK